MLKLNLKTQSWVTVLACAGLLSACGGSSTSTPEQVAAIPILSANSLSVAGLVSGLGSVIVNGVRYETIGAKSVDSDDKKIINSQIGIGMILSLEPSSFNTAAASTIHIQKGIKGPIANVNAAQYTLTVAGLPVTGDATTLVVKANGTIGNFAELANNSVEVYGLPQTNGNFKATRIEIESSPSLVQLSGAISELNTTNTTFKLGSGNNLVTISYGALTVATGLANGVVVSVHTNAMLSTNQYAATQIYLRAPSALIFNEYATNYKGTSNVRNETNELYGMVSGLSSIASGCNLQVQGVSVNVASTTLCNSIQNGDYVEVKGILSNGSLTAHRIEFRTTGGDRNLNGYSDDKNDDNHDELKYSRLLTTSTGNDSTSPNISSASSSTYEMYGTLSNCATGTCTLMSNGVAITIDISSAIWEHGLMVTVGAVEAKGYMTLNNIFKVTNIESKNSS